MTIDELKAMRPDRRGKCGAGAIEYVVIAVLIAAACLVGVIVFGRGIIRNTDIMDKGISGRGERAGEAAEIYRADTADDVKEAKKFPREFSDIGD